jgi:hypothetical protein
MTFESDDRLYVPSIKPVSYPRSQPTSGPSRAVPPQVLWASGLPPAKGDEYKEFRSAVRYMYSPVGPTALIFSSFSADHDSKSHVSIVPTTDIPPTTTFGRTFKSHRKLEDKRFSYLVYLEWHTVPAHDHPLHSLNAESSGPNARQALDTSHRAVRCIYCSGNRRHASNTGCQNAMTTLFGTAVCLLPCWSASRTSNAGETAILIYS